MAMVAGLVEAAVAPAEAAGMDGDAVEAEAWAYLAVRLAEGPAHHVSRHHRRSPAAHGRRAGEARLAWRGRRLGRAKR